MSKSECTCNSAATLPTSRTSSTALICNLTGKVRRETLDGREYLVAPLRMLVPGVLNGSKGPLLYPPDEVKRSISQWDNTPIMLNHPMDNGTPVSAKHPGMMDKYSMGFVRKPHCNNQLGALDAEGWFDVENTKRISPQVFMSLGANKPIELSTGLFTENIEANGDHHGKPYSHIARNYKSDHLAVLVDKTGACSLNDGCGVLVNQAKRGLASMPTLNHIIKTKKGFRLISHKGKNLGDFPSHEAAAKHEGEVEYFKHANNSVSSIGYGLTDNPQKTNCQHCHSVIPAAKSIHDKCPKCGKPITMPDNDTDAGLQLKSDHSQRISNSHEEEDTTWCNFCGELTPIGHDPKICAVCGGYYDRPLLPQANMPLSNASIDEKLARLLPDARFTNISNRSLNGTATVNLFGFGGGAPKLGVSTGASASAFHHSYRAQGSGLAADHGSASAKHLIAAATARKAGDEDTAKLHEKYAALHSMLAKSGGKLHPKYLPKTGAKLFNSPSLNEAQTPTYNDWSKWNQEHKGQANGGSIDQPNRAPAGVGFGSKLRRGVGYGVAATGSGVASFTGTRVGLHVGGGLGAIGGRAIGTALAGGAGGTVGQYAGEAIGGLLGGGVGSQLGRKAADSTTTRVGRHLAGAGAESGIRKAAQLGGDTGELGGYAYDFGKAALKGVKGGFGKGGPPEHHGSGLGYEPPHAGPSAGGLGRPKAGGMTEHPSMAAEEASWKADTSNRRADHIHAAQMHKQAADKTTGKARLLHLAKSMNHAEKSMTANQANELNFWDESLTDNHNWQKWDEAHRSGASGVARKAAGFTTGLAGGAATTYGTVLAGSYGGGKLGASIGGAIGKAIKGPVGGTAGRILGHFAGSLGGGIAGVVGGQHAAAHYVVPIAKKVAGEAPDTRPEALKKVQPFEPTSSGVGTALGTVVGGLYGSIHGQRLLEKGLTKDMEAHYGSNVPGGEWKKGTPYEEHEGFADDSQAAQDKSAAWWKGSPEPEVKSGTKDSLPKFQKTNRVGVARHMKNKFKSPYKPGDTNYSNNQLTRWF